MGGFELETELGNLFQTLGPGAYALLFGAVLLQTANPVGAAVPGNPLLFVLGLLNKTSLGAPLPGLIAGLAVAAFLGNLIGFASGKWLGPKAFASPKARPFEAKVDAFFAKHGDKAVGLAFFLPFVRCFMPLFAGAGQMPWPRFVLFSALGATAWTAVFLTAGYSFGELPAVRQNLEAAVLVIGALVIVKIALEARRAQKAQTTASQTRP